MPPTVKWKCTACGKERMMSPEVTLVLCPCNYKNLKRVSPLKSSSLKSEGNSRLFED